MAAIRAARPIPRRRGLPLLLFTDVLAPYSLGLAYLVGLTARYRRARARWG